MACQDLHSLANSLANSAYHSLSLVTRLRLSGCHEITSHENSVLVTRLSIAHSKICKYYPVQSTSLNIVLKLLPGFPQALKLSVLHVRVNCLLEPLNYQLLFAHSKHCCLGGAWGACYKKNFQVHKLGVRSHDM